MYNKFNRTRQGYVFRNILKLAGRFFVGWSMNYNKLYAIFRLTLPHSKPRHLRTNMNVHQPDMLYNSLVMLLHFLDVIQPGHARRKELLALLDQYQVATEAMGFPTHWRTLPIWRVN